MVTLTETEIGEKIGDYHLRLPAEARKEAAEIEDNRRKAFIFSSWVAYYQRKIEDVMEKWYEKEAFLKTEKGKSVVYLRLIIRQTGKNPLYAVQHRNYFAKVIRDKYKEVEIAHDIEKVEFPTNIGLFDRIREEVSGWGANAENLDEYIKALQKYAQEIKKVFGEKYYNEFMEKDAIRHLMFLLEEYQYLGAERYMDRFGKEQAGMMFNAMKAYSGKTKEDWEPFIDMVRKFKGKGKNEFIKLFGDARTAAALIACRKKYYEYPTKWVDVLNWILKRDLPGRAKEIIEKAKGDVLEVVEELKKRIFKELKKDIRAYERVLLKGEQKIIDVWQKYRQELDKMVGRLASETANPVLLMERFDLIAKNSIHEGSEIEKMLDRQLPIQKRILETARYAAMFNGSDEAFADLHLKVLPWIRDVWTVSQRETGGMVKVLKKSGSLDKIAKIGGRLLTSAYSCYILSQKILRFCQDTHKELNLGEEAETSTEDEGVVKFPKTPKRNKTPEEEYGYDVSKVA